MAKTKTKMGQKNTILIKIKKDDFETKKMEKKTKKWFCILILKEEQRKAKKEDFETDRKTNLRQKRPLMYLVMEKSWKSHEKLEVKTCTNPVIGLTLDWLQTISGLKLG